MRPGADSRAGRRRRATPAARHPGPPGRRVGPAALAGCRSVPVPERLADPADVSGEHRQAPGQRLGDDHAVRLPPCARRARAGRRRRRAARSSAAPVRGPAKRTRSRQPAAQRAAPHAVGGSRAAVRSRLPTQAQRQDRSVTVASPSSSTSCPLARVTAATHSSASPAALPGASSAASTRLGQDNGDGPCCSLRSRLCSRL